MVGLVGVAGLAGAGKTTAVTYLSEVTGGQSIYLGEVVLKEIRARGLPQTRDNEKQVRIDLRRNNGPAALAIPFKDSVAGYLAGGTPTFIDAIFLQEEFDALSSCSQGPITHLLAIEASFEVRYSRLKDRPDRPFNRDELADRDKMELETLGTGRVISGASYTIRNEDSFEKFYNQLADFLISCSAGSV
jgi:dephospho-CoA kinase